MSINPRVAAILPSYDPTKPVVVVRGFLGGVRKYKPNEPFDVEAERATHGQVETLVRSGYLKNGTPIEIVKDPAREEQKRKRFEAKAAAERDIERSRVRRREGRPHPGGPVKSED